jgi:hypothetical protein
VIDVAVCAVVETAAGGSTAPELVAPTPLAVVVQAANAAVVTTVRRPAEITATLRLRFAARAFIGLDS